MKNVIIAFVGLGIVLSSCDHLRGYVKGAKTAEDSSAAKDHYVAARDASITTANAYNNLFLDSTAVETYIQNNQLNDTAARQIRSFYNQRNYQFAWLAPDGFTEQGRGLWNLLDQKEAAGDSTFKNDSLEQKIDTLLEMDTLTVNATDSSFIQTELALTQRYVQYASTHNPTSPKGYNFFLPVKKVDALQLADSLLNHPADSSFEQSHTAYSALKTALRKYYTLAQQGGWQPIMDSAVNVKKGDSSPVVVSIKKRLALSGDWSAADTSQVFNDSLEVAIRSFQQRHGFKPDGVVTDSLIKEMNIPAQERVEQILVNMNRLLWSQPKRPDHVIEVNIPAFMLHVYEGPKKVMDMEVVVGKEGSNTLMFSGALNQVVFNPYWNIPASIVQQEIMPAMQADPNYLKKHNMEMVNKNDSIPVIRQLPGSQNSLGKVNFLFPNNYDIFFHDTPAKGLFEQDKRAFSHGCIRLADAEKMAQYILRNDSDWTPEKIKAAINSGKEQTVNLKQPVPVMISYNTVWVDENGQVHFREDVYGHDTRTRKMMFTPVS